MRPRVQSSQEGEETTYQEEEISYIDIVHFCTFCTAIYCVTIKVNINIKEY